MLLTNGVGMGDSSGVVAIKEEAGVLLCSSDSVGASDDSAR